MSTDLAVRKVQELALPDARLAELEQLLRSGEQPKWEQSAQDPEQVAKEILEQILSATTEDELDAISRATGWRELPGVPVEIHGFKPLPSRFDGEGPKWFAVVQGIRMDSGLPVVLTTGSLNVLGQLVRLAGMKAFPCVRYLEERETQTKGRSVLWLATPESVKVQRATVQGSAS